MFKKKRADVIRNNAVPSSIYTRIVDGHHVIVDPSRDVAYVCGASSPSPYVVSISVAAVALARPVLDRMPQGH